MCGRFFVPPEGDVSGVLEILEELEHRNVLVRRGEVSPGDLAAVVAANRRMEPTAFGMRWGYRLGDGKLVFNTRSETAAQKPMFADGITQRRCLIPAQHYFEWQKTEAGKRKFAIAPTGSDGFYLAGIYRMEGREPVFSILTRSPAPSIAHIHDRMPVILPETAKADWLNPRWRGEEILKAAETDMVFLPCT